MESGTRQQHTATHYIYIYMHIYIQSQLKSIDYTLHLHVCSLQGQASMASALQFDSTAPVPLEYSWRPLVVTSGSPAGSHLSLSGSVRTFEDHEDFN